VNGGEKFTQYEPRQLIDIFEFSFLPVGENPDKLRRLRLEKKFSLRQIAKTTGHSVSYLQQQLRKFGIENAKGNFGVAPYGWDWTDRKLVPNEKEQGVICEMIRLRQSGRSANKISAELNLRGVPAKGGGRWWPMTVSKVIKRKLEK
jgi:Recombinase